MVKRIKHEQGNSSFEFRRNVLEALLVSSITNESFKFPTIQEFILGEVLDGVIDYIGGTAGKVNFGEFIVDRNIFEKELVSYFNTEMEKYSKEKLSPNIKSAIIGLSNYSYINPAGPERPFPHTELYNHFNGFDIGRICPLTFESSFSLPSKFISQVKKEILPRFSSSEIKDIIGISKHMRKYVEKDLEFIGRNYQW